jgi:uncharacterized membrane protein YdbT with pleckstrin-like domain
MPLCVFPGLLAFFALVALFLLVPLALMIFFVAILSACVQFLRHRNTEFALTDRRLLVKTGWITHTASEVLLNKIESIHVKQDVLGRQFSFGSIVVTGTGGSNEVIMEMNEPFDFYRNLQEQLAALKSEARYSG